MEEKLCACEKILEYRFEDRLWLVRALTHASAQSDEAPFGYERLEFLGDGAIDLIIGLMLFERYPDWDEGWLTRARAMLVNADSLARRARDAGLDHLLILGKGEEKAGGRKKISILAGVYEAVVGAVLVDGGYGSIEPIVKRHFRDVVENIHTLNTKNYKSLLQEKIQVELQTLPDYEVVECFGPEHEKRFIVRVSVDGEEWGRGEGKSKKDAEMAAARNALEK
ncbi:MAG: ribonuclease III [Deltaproteobacteria bacterium]|nr:ribonuclease III [Candidatus Zymogenaceae bacterium]